LNLDDYQNFVVKLASDKSDLATAAIGICDESAELFSATGEGAATLADVLKECSDVLWYCTYGAYRLGTALSTMLSQTTQTDLTDCYGDRAALISSLSFFRESLVVRAGSVAGAIKKVLYHGHDAGVEHVEWKISLVLESLLGIAAVFGITTQEIIDANVEKLSQRYGEKFSEERSIWRKEGV
jgi:NTP pyrophosphatase (non-canonical NTP hydrolase)